MVMARAMGIIYHRGIDVGKGEINGHGRRGRWVQSHLCWASSIDFGAFFPLLQDCEFTCDDDAAAVLGRRGTAAAVCSD